VLVSALESPTPALSADCDSAGQNRSALISSCRAEPASRFCWP